MSADKRSTHTDALATLGTSPIPENSGRDAIHLAVEPVIAGRYLSPGEKVGIVAGRATTITTKFVGIVDPFLPTGVSEGEMFWLVVFPRQITSLRHVWSHPDFPEPIENAAPIPTAVSPTPEQMEAWNWIDDFAEDLDLTTDELMEAANLWVATDDGNFGGEYTYDNSEKYKDHWDKFEEFWEKYETATGNSPRTKGSFFTCSC